MNNTIMTSVFHSFGEKLIIFLLVANILAASFGTVAIIHNSEQTQIQELENLAETANITRGIVTAHNNITQQGVQLLLEDKEQSDRLLEPLLYNISQTYETSQRVEEYLQNATAERATSTRQIDNNNMLREILNVLTNQTSNSTSVVGNG